MQIVLDTNTLVAGKLNSPRFEILRNYLTRTRSTVFMPGLVYSEVAATYARDLRHRVSVFARAQGDLQVLLTGARLPALEVSVDEQARAFLARLRAAVDLGLADVKDAKPEHLAQALDRAIHRRAPCTDRGEEIRDAVIWLAVLDAAAGPPPVSTAFISENTKQFGAPGGGLHPVLAQECKERKVEVSYFSSLEEFLKQHAVQIEFITRAWLHEHINTREVLRAAARSIEESFEQAAGREWREATLTGHVEVIDGGAAFDLEEFYVHEMRRNAYRVEIEYFGRVEIEYEVERMVTHTTWEMEIDPGTGEPEPTPVQRTVVEPDLDSAHPEVTVSVDVLVEDGQVKEWKVLDSSVYLR